MDQYVTGLIIKELREKKKITQVELARELNVSDKTISKWETGNGYPDITLLESIAKAFDISITELLSGSAIKNSNISGNVLRSKLYVCPVCGNVIFSMGETVISCHGITLMPLEAELSDEGHKIIIEKVEDEYFVQIEHNMEKAHHISFIAAVSNDRLQLVKLYPESNSEARFSINGVKKVYAYCNRDGLFYIDVDKRIDGKEKSYDDIKERKELEEAAKTLFE